MEKQRILIVHNYYQIPGGEDTVVENEKKLLEEQGHFVVLYSRNNLEIKEMNIVKKIFLPYASIFNFRTYWEIKKLIREKRIDIVHVHNTLSLISPSVYYAARVCSIPVIQTVHNFRLLCPGAMFYRDGHICEDCVKLGLRCAVKYNCYRKSKIQTLICVINSKIHRMIGIYGEINYICLTAFNKEKLLSIKQIKGDRVFVKPNFTRKKLIFIPKNKRKNQFIFAGRLDITKGIDILFESWKNMGLGAPKLIVCGKGPMEKWCKDFVNNNKVNIELKGFVSNLEIQELLAVSKALVLPTLLFEGFPMSIVEAYSVGTPVVASDQGNVGSIVIEGKTGSKFNLEIDNSINVAIKRLDDYKDIYTSTIEEYEKKYSQTSNYNELIKIYSLVK